MLRQVPVKAAGEAVTEEYGAAKAGVASLLLTLPVAVGACLDRVDLDTGRGGEVEAGAEGDLFDGEKIGGDQPQSRRLAEGPAIAVSLPREWIETCARPDWKHQCTGAFSRVDSA